MSSDAIRVLVVEDDDLIGSGLKAYLEDEGFDVRHVLTAGQALAVIPDWMPQAAIIDLRLPDMAGDEFVARAHAMADDLCFLIHTGSSGFKLTDALRKLGICNDQVFLKPVADMDALVATIRRLVRAVT